jgi:hypothetical protein
MPFAHFHATGFGPRETFMKVSDIIGSVILLLFSSAAYYQATQFTLGAGGFPKAVLIAIMILAAVQLLLAFRPSAVPATTASSETLNVGKIIAIAVLFFAYIVSIQLIGYFIATPLFLIVAMVMLGRRDAKTILAVTVAVNVAIWLIFRAFLYVPVPMGPLFKY